jgi:hypothetical protein
LAKWSESARKMFMKWSGNTFALVASCISKNYRRSRTSGMNVSLRKRRWGQNQKGPKRADDAVVVVGCVTTSSSTMPTSCRMPMANGGGGPTSLQVRPHALDPTCACSTYFYESAMSADGDLGRPAAPMTA